MPFMLSDFVSGAKSMQEYKDLQEAQQAKKDLARIAMEAETPTKPADTRMVSGFMPGESGGMPTDTKDLLGAAKELLPGTTTPKEGLTGLGGMQQGISGVEPTPAGVKESPLKVSISAVQESNQQLTAIQKQMALNAKYAEYFNKKGQPGLANEAITKNIELQKSQYDIQQKHLENTKKATELLGGQAGAYVDAADDPAREPMARAELIRQAQELGNVPPQRIMAMATMPVAQLKALMQQTRDGSLTAYQQAEETRKTLQAENAALKLEQSLQAQKRKEILDNQKIAASREGNIRKTIAEKRAEGYSPETDPEKFTADELAWYKTGAIPGVTKDEETGAVAVAVSPTAAPGEVVPGKTLTDFASKIKFAEGSAQTAVSPKGAKGTMQVLDSTNMDPGLGVTPARDNSLEERDRVGRDYANALLKKYNGNEDLAAAAYNWGFANVDKALAKGGVAEVYRTMPQETANYLKRIASAGEAPTAPAAATDKLTELYDKKQGGGLTRKEWDSINPTAVQIGKEYRVPPTQMASSTPEEKKQAISAYRVSQETEDVAKFIVDHPKAVGTLAAITKAAGGMSGNLQDNMAADKRYTGDVAVLGKKLFTLGLKDAAASAGGRMNVFLEKSFAKLYDQSLSPESLIRVIKARQDDSFNLLNDIYGADKAALNKSKYPLAFTDDVKNYMKSGSDWESSAPLPGKVAGKGTKEDPIVLN